MKCGSSLGFEDGGFLFMDHEIELFIYLFNWFLLFFDCKFVSVDNSSAVQVTVMRHAINFYHYKVGGPCSAALAAFN